MKEETKKHVFTGVMKHERGRESIGSCTGVMKHEEGDQLH
jgi:hypothetical protein